MWKWPVASGIIAMPVAWAFDGLRVDAVAGPSFTGDHDSARALFQLTATAVMAATTLTFSITLLALQMASQQFSPRLLREFARDSVTKSVLCVLTASFTFSSAALVLLDDESEPALSMVTAFALAVASLVAILGFITHMLRSIRVDTMMLNVHDDTIAAIELFYPPRGQPTVAMPDQPDAAPEMVTADRSGFVRAIDVDLMVGAARSHDTFVRVEVRAGDHVIEGSPVATVWGSSDVSSHVRRAITLGYERTIDQDVAFGFRQLEDIAVKAMSPSINDPVTAAHAVGHMGALLVRVLGCRLGPTVHVDDDGVPRAVVPDRDLRYYLDLACGQLRRFGQREPTVLGAMLRMLRDVGFACHDDAQRCEVRRAARLVLTQATDIRDADMELLGRLSTQVDLALTRSPGAHDDRAGETRSL